MRKHATTIGLAVISLASFAQNSVKQFSKPELKSILSNLSYVPSKSFTSLSYTGSDSVSFYTPRIASSHGFYISRFEVSNKEYREFVIYARDSMAHTLLKHFKKSFGLLDWSRRINWKDPLLEPMMLLPEDRIFGRREINTDKIEYKTDISSQSEIINIYPDTLVWISDFTYSYNEPLVKNYFSKKSYDNFPVVGISLKQAMAFCQWKTEQLNKLLNHSGSEYRVKLRLPTNTEWESASTGEKDEKNIFSPGRAYQINFGVIADRNGFIVKQYKDDGYFYTGPVNSYTAGAYGIYQMKGNVAEWTLTPCDEIMNLEVKSEKLKTSFTVKGGGWDSDPFYLQTGACQFFSANDAHSFIGFRYIVNIEKK